MLENLERDLKIYTLQMKYETFKNAANILLDKSLEVKKELEDLRKDSEPSKDIISEDRDVCETSQEAEKSYGNVVTLGDAKNLLKDGQQESVEERRERIKREAAQGLRDSPEPLFGKRGKKRAEDQEGIDIPEAPKTASGALSKNEMFVLKAATSYGGPFLPEYIHKILRNNGTKISLKDVRNSLVSLKKLSKLESCMIKTDEGDKRWFQLSSSSIPIKDAVNSLLKRRKRN